MKCKLTTQEKLKDLRIEKGLSLEQLADADDAIKILQDGKYNPLLLNEMLTNENENFLRLIKVQKTLPYM